MAGWLAPSVVVEGAAMGVAVEVVVTVYLATAQVRGAVTDGPVGQGWRVAPQGGRRLRTFWKQAPLC